MMTETYNETITRREFVRLLFEREPEELSTVIPAENLAFGEEATDRKTAAVLLHIFLLTELKEPDESDISGASILRDLYDCRVCVNHIAQVYLKGIMEACDYRELSKTGEPGDFLLFDGNKTITSEEAKTCRARALGSLPRLKNSAK